MEEGDKDAIHALEQWRDGYRLRRLFSRTSSLPNRCATSVINSSKEDPAAAADPGCWNSVAIHRAPEPHGAERAGTRPVGFATAHLWMRPGLEWIRHLSIAS